MASTTHQKYWTLATSALATLILGCAPPQPDDGEECYDGGAEVLDVSIHWLCGEATNDFWDEHPDSPDFVSVCEAADGPDDCNLCPAEDIDAILADEIVARELSSTLEGRPGCDGEFSDFVRSCGGYIEEHGGQCCYTAWYAGGCDLKIYDL